MIISTLIRKLAQWQRYRRNVAELSVLSDRSLADIGINRQDIERIAKGAARG